MEDFRRRIPTRKGEYAEKLVRDYWESKINFVVYWTQTEGRHPWDMLIVPRNGEGLFVCDAKAKAHRTHYEDTGIDTRHYKEYMENAQKYGKGMFIMFVDELEGEAYGNWLSVLSEHITEIDEDNKIVYFSLKCMDHKFDLTYEQQQELKRLSTRNSAYGG